MCCGNDWLGFLEAYRTLCFSPNADIQVYFEQLRTGEMAKNITKNPHKK
jgi:hypothetical protein